MWYHIAPEVGKRVALALYQEMRYTPVAPTLRCVVDLDADPGSLATLRGMVAADELPSAKKIQAMQRILADRSAALPLRTLAIQYLTGPEMRDPKVRLSVVQQFGPIASDPTRPHDQRMEALEFVKSAYDAFSKDSEVNDQILSIVADRMADPDQELRSSAVQFLGPKLVGFAKKGTLDRIHFSDRESVIRYLEKDAAGSGDDSPQARSILQALKQ